MRYTACGLTLTANASIAGLAPGPADTAADVSVALHGGEPLPCTHPSDRTWYVYPEADERGTPWLEAATGEDGSRWLRYGEGAVFRVDATAQRVDAWWQLPLTEVDAATYLLGPVLAFIMRLRGLVPLHASGVAIDGRAVLFAGSPGAGKSSTAAAFASLGFPVLSDDVVPMQPLAAGTLAWPGYPRLSLWGDAAEALFGDECLPPYSATYTKQYLDLGGVRRPFQSTPLPVGVVFVLDAAGDADPGIRPLAPRDAVVALLRHTFGTYLIDMGLRAREFEVLAGMVAAVPVWRLRFGTALGDITRQCLTVADHVRHTIYHGARPEAGLAV
ncbi:MAG TPA: hypothetical protein VGQ37_21690 [Vicinamibacterales bacterium]|jgi:hypothetical protein|nr:hypothetical protein [Vicinamibacterales bacterium]